LYRSVGIGEQSAEGVGSWVQSQPTRRPIRTEWRRARGGDGGGGDGAGGDGGGGDGGGGAGGRGAGGEGKRGGCGGGERGEAGV
jgi:hypothetical protein